MPYSHTFKVPIPVGQQVHERVIEQTLVVGRSLP